MKLVQVADEIIKELAGDPGATVTVTVEIHASFPGGASENLKRAVTQNAAELGFKSKTWE